jgi:hypothetical protein
LKSTMADDVANNNAHQEPAPKIKNNNSKTNYNHTNMQGTKDIDNNKAGKKSTNLHLYGDNTTNSNMETPSEPSTNRVYSTDNKASFADSITYTPSKTVPMDTGNTNCEISPNLKPKTRSDPTDTTTPNYTQNTQLSTISTKLYNFNREAALFEGLTQEDI